MAGKPAVVITHPTDGIFIGVGLGMAFFSKSDPVGQNAAVAFVDEADARAFVGTWNPPMEGLDFHKVEADIIDGDRLYASVDACERAGLERWDPDFNQDDCPTPGF